MKRTTKSRMAGVTLLELLIVVVIVGILASIAYPGFQQQSRKAKRADGKSALLNTSQILERCYTRAATYVGCANAAFPITSPDRNYSVTATAMTASTYTLSAAPQGGQASDAECGALTLTSTGAPGSQGATGTDANGCW